LHGGLKFYAAYPMTPSSSILSTLAELAPTYGHITRHAEDEISAINLAIGASFAGVRAATGTSGGGFCLMTEGLGLAAETETPLVIINAMRPGPSTGLPTWTEQGDLRMVMHASQGDFPRVVVAPGDVEQAFLESARALNLAEKFHLQVIILTDKYLAESHWSSPVFHRGAVQYERGGFVSATDIMGKDYYERYADTPTGVTLRPIPGQPGGVFTANSDEHTPIGHTDETSENRIMQVQKRNRKLETMLAQFPPRVMQYGDADAEVTFVTWGSATISCREAVRKLNAMGIISKVLQVLYILPFPVEELQAVLKNSKHLILVENNFSGQLGGVIREYTGQTFKHQLLKFDGRPFWPEDIANFVKGIV
jgi:2-oxoglutarate ferredoxin oxidoreductase subunit alpha